MRKRSDEEPEGEVLPFQVRIPRQLKEAIEALALRERRSQSKMGEILLEEALAHRSNREEVE